MYPLIYKSTAFPLLFKMVDATDGITPELGLTVTVQISKNGSSFDVPAGAISEIGEGWYQVAGNAVDTDSLGPLILIAAAAGARTAEEVYHVARPIQLQQPAQLVPYQSTGIILFRLSGLAASLPTVTLSKNGNTLFLAAAGTVSAIGSTGLYKLTPTAVDTGTLGPLVLRATGTVGLVPETHDSYHYVFADATSAVATAVDAALQDDFDGLNVEAGFNRAGAGAYPWTAHIVDDENAPIPDAEVWLTNDADGENVVAGYITTDDNGDAEFLVDADTTYYLWAKAAGKMHLSGESFTYSP
jgi:hypothetical protein